MMNYIKSTFSSTASGIQKQMDDSICVMRKKMLSMGDQIQANILQSIKSNIESEKVQMVIRDGVTKNMENVFLDPITRQSIQKQVSDAIHAATPQSNQHGGGRVKKTRRHQKLKLKRKSKQRRTRRNK